MPSFGGAFFIRNRRHGRVAQSPERVREQHETVTTAAVDHRGDAVTPFGDFQVEIGISADRRFQRK
jgi:hypothetical protein